MQLGLEKRLLIAALRTTVQLLLIGQVLGLLFTGSNLLYIAGIAALMLLIAGREVMARQKRRIIGVRGMAIGTVSMFLSSFTITLLALVVIIGNEPWYEPRYAIPLIGMLLGNTMTGVALAMDRLSDTMYGQRLIIEQRLLLGQSSSEAVREIRREALRSGMIPNINAMATAGLVYLPGMMTGQILGGSPPMEAVKYQILIMFLICAGTGFGVLAALWLVNRELFDERERLRLDVLGPEKKG
jgi:putative ABC transport system permease protein